MRSKKILFAMMATLTMGFHSPAGLTDAEREYALHFLQETRTSVLEKVSGLTPEQWTFKADTATWSIAECVEHIAIAEQNIFGLAETALKVPADPGKRNQVTMGDEALVKMITNRNPKVKTTETLKPSGKFGTYAAALDAFRTERDNHIAYIKKTSDDLRNHYYDFPFGKLDAYQTILLMTAHSQRHADQIGEIMKDVNFPQKGK